MKFDIESEVCGHVTLVAEGRLEQYGLLHLAPITIRLELAWDQNPMLNTLHIRVKYTSITK